MCCQVYATVQQAIHCDEYGTQHIDDHRLYAQQPKHISYLPQVKSTAFCGKQQESVPFSGTGMSRSSDDRGAGRVLHGYNSGREEMR